MTPYLLYLVAGGAIYLLWQRYSQRLAATAFGGLTAFSVLTMPAAPALAQSSTIDLQGLDMTIFFTWFNQMFSAFAPIMLMIAGITVGVAFAKGLPGFFSSIKF